MSLIESIKNMGKGRIMKEILDRTSQNIKELLSKDSDFRQIPQPTSTCYRLYQKISFYVSGIPEDNSILDCLKTKKLPVKCPEDCCCFNLEKMGSFSLEKSTWKSKCPNRKEKIECGAQSHKGVCFNMSIAMGKGKKLKVDVEERVCWGVDSFTRNLMVRLMSSKVKTEKKQQFIQFDLIKALNQQVNLFKLMSFYKVFIF